MKTRFCTAVVLLAGLAGLSSSAFALDTSKLKPTGYVNDFAHTLDARSAQALEAYCTELERATGAQMAIVLVDTLDNEPVEDAANRLFREWGIGKKGKDEGVLYLLAVKDHRQRIEVGYGLEPILPDGFVGGVMRGIAPILRQGNYGGALLAAAQQMGSRIAQAKGVELQGQAPLTGVRPAQRGPSIPWPLVLGGFFLVIWLIGKMSGGSGTGGGGTGFLTGMLLGNMMGRRGGWGGGGFGGYDGGGGGGGGFGGFGGGDSGGGGASGGW